jgi:hypothetical protein
MMSFDDLAPYVRKIVREEISGDVVLATVTSKVGTQVMVQRITGSAPEGPYATAAGASGVLQVGDLVQMTNVRSGSPLVGLPVERSTRSALSIVGEDLGPAQTTSHTTWVTLLEVDGLAIPSSTPCWIEFAGEVVTVGGAGSSDKQFRIVYNEDEAINTLDVTATSALFIFPMYLTGFLNFSSDTPRRALFDLGTPGAISTFVGDITRIRIQARTNDTAEGNDIVIASDLVVRL